MLYVGRSIDNYQQQNMSNQIEMANSLEFKSPSPVAASFVMSIVSFASDIRVCCCLQSAAGQKM
jgi:hypothetical protein